MRNLLIVLSTRPTTLSENMDAFVSFASSPLADMSTLGIVP